MVWFPVWAISQIQKLFQTRLKPQIIGILLSTVRKFVANIHTYILNLIHTSSPKASHSCSLSVSCDTINKHLRSCSFLELTTTACTVTTQSCAVPEQLSSGLYGSCFATQWHFSPVWSQTIKFGVCTPTPPTSTSHTHITCHHTIHLPRKQTQDRGDAAPPPPPPPPSRKHKSGVTRHLHHHRHLPCANMSWALAPPPPSTGTTSTSTLQTSVGVFSHLFIYIINKLIYYIENVVSHPHITSGARTQRQ
jgi:hypothetical protein